jgi:hypothetical protein
MTKKVITENEQKKNTALSGVVLGIIGIFFIWAWFISGPIGIIGLTLSIKALKTSKYKLAVFGTVISGISVVSSVGYFLLLWMNGYL